MKTLLLLIVAALLAGCVTRIERSNVTIAPNTHLRLHAVPLP